MFTPKCVGNPLDGWWYHLLTWGIGFFWKISSKGMSIKSKLNTKEMGNFSVYQLSNAREHFWLGWGQARNLIN